ncbi:MAG: hypothetical protein M0042_11680 [Nitrospiraceae bacterium]|nr:hypothetical protein [Nitrospiraceae bacterium]
MVRTVTRILAVMLLVALLPLSLPHRSFAEVNDDYALKISLENQLERKLKQVIMEITGTDRVVIFVNAEIASKGGAGDRGKIEKKADALVLPGVPAKKEFGTGQTSELMLPGSGKFTVNKIVLSIWLDKSVPGSIADLIQDIAKNVIGYSQTRGDQINIKRVDFESKGFSWASLFLPPNIFWLILSLLGGFMLYTVGMFFLAPNKKIAPALKDIDWNAIRGTGGGASATTVERTTTFEREILAERPAASGGAGAAAVQEAGLPFSFVRERDIPAVAFLLRDKTPQDIAIVVNYLEPSLAMRLLESFPKERQVEVALILGREEIGTDKVPGLEEQIKSRLTYVVGGENKLLALLDMTNEDVRDKVVKSMETKDAQTATRLKSRIKSLETIIRELPAPGVQTLFRNVNPVLFAQVLKSSPDEIQQKVITSLSAGAAERLKEEMQLSRALSAVRLRRERQNLMAVVRRLISEGLVEVENS